MESVCVLLQDLPGPSAADDNGADQFLSPEDFRQVQYFVCGGVQTAYMIDRITLLLYSNLPTFSAYRTRTSVLTIHLSIITISLTREL